MNRIVGIVCFGLALVGSAHAYVMSGIDTHLNLNQQVTLVDQEGEKLVLDNGSYRLRFSLKSSSFHIMANHNHKQEFKVDGNFPNRDLKNFTLDGEKFGNPGIILQGTTRDVTKGSYEHTYTQSETYVCGYDTVCTRVHVGQKCEDRPGGKKVCTDIYENRCRNVTRICPCSSTYHATRVNSGRLFTLEIFSGNKSNRVGEFKGYVDGHNNSYDVNKRLISTSCGHGRPTHGGRIGY